jgi:hypothetical protein
MSMRVRRNVITLSHLDPELEEWAREEAKRTSKHFYEIVNDALKLRRAVVPVAHDLGALLQEIEAEAQPDEELKEIMAGNERRDP